MSSECSIFLITKDRFEEFCAMAKLMPLRIDRECTAANSVELQMLKPQSASIGSDAQERQFKRLWDYIESTAQEPVRFTWAGFVMNDLLRYLESARDINLREFTYGRKNGDWKWYVFNSETKRRYLKLLDPTQFSESELQTAYLALLKSEQEMAIRELAKSLPKEHIQQALRMMTIGREDDFPERGKAMMDGVKVIYHYLSQIDDRSVAMLYIG